MAYRQLYWNVKYPNYWGLPACLPPNLQLSQALLVNSHFPLVSGGASHPDKAALCLKAIDNTLPHTRPHRSARHPK